MVNGNQLISLHKIQYVARSRLTHLDHVTTLDFHLIDLGLGDVGTLFGLLQLVLHLPQLRQMGVGLLLLSNAK